MFFVINKEKIYTYMVSVVTVVFLFIFANYIILSEKETIETSTNTEKLVPIYNVQTTENNIALTMNCAWNADDIDQILEILNKNNVKITFFMVGEWIDKYPEAVKKIYEAGHEIRYT